MNLSYMRRGQGDSNGRGLPSGLGVAGAAAAVVGGGGSGSSGGGGGGSGGRGGGRGGDSGAWLQIIGQSPRKCSCMGTWLTWRGGLFRTSPRNQRSRKPKGFNPTTLG